MFDDTGNIVQLSPKLGPVENLVEMPVDNKIAVIGNQWPGLCLRLSYYRLASESALDFELNAPKVDFELKNFKI